MVGRPLRGVLGGTFDPVHLGHLLAAEEARAALSLVDVVFVPAGEPWMKSGATLAPAEDRWNMVRLAIASNPAFRASRVDLDRPGPSYSIDTLRDLLRLEPAEYVFIMGMDSLVGVPRWKQPEELLELCRLAAFTRPGYDAEQALAALYRVLPQARERVRLLEGVNVDISATDIRRRRREGRPIKYRVPEAVEQYIMARGLYRT